ncbi:hypothetical protein CIPAW_14G005600 [Carya illinoinensis]|uniref:Uncharacterized protein n=1 Tax=Carya illinoinensis TaxID=32201 RepID=A0A8T1ND98_CARIL|nr:hypothetical protein CIPAW_14G005600 [Carya illinoinensis]
MVYLKYRGYRTPPPSPSPPPCPFLSRFSLRKILFFPLYFDFVQYAKRMGIRAGKTWFHFPVQKPTEHPPTKEDNTTPLSCCPMHRVVIATKAYECQENHNLDFFHMHEPSVLSSPL